MIQKILVCLVLSCVIGWGGNRATAQIAAERVLEVYVEETGGKQRYKALKNWRIQAKMLGLAQRKPNEKTPPDGSSMMEFRTDVKFDKDGRYLGKLEFLKQNLRIGSDSVVHWLKNGDKYQLADKGSGVNSGKEILDIEKLLQPSEKFKSLKHVGLEKINGEICNEIHMTEENGRLTKEFYATGSGLRLKSETTIDQRNGKRKVERIYSKYESTKCGILLPMKFEVFYNGKRVFIVNITSFESNESIDEETFELPKEVKALISRGVPQR